METDINTVRGLVAQLSEADQRELYADLAYQHDREAKPDPWTPDERLVWAAIVRVSDGPCPPLDVFARQANRITAEKIRTNFAWINAYVDRSSSPGNTGKRHAVRSIVLPMVMDCLAVWLRELRISVRPASLINHTVSLPRAVENCYPGYASSRILDRVALQWAKTQLT